jgi:polyribonucleotide nucleotidyltransferase
MRLIVKPIHERLIVVSNRQSSWQAAPVAVQRLDKLAIKIPWAQTSGICSTCLASISNMHVTALAAAAATAILAGGGGGRQSDEPPEVGTCHRGEVKRIEAYGVFVALQGYRKYGLVHASQVRCSVHIAVCVITNRRLHFATSPVVEPVTGSVG